MNGDFEFPCDIREPALQIGELSSTRGPRPRQLTRLWARDRAVQKADEQQFLAMHLDRFDGDANR